MSDCEHNEVAYFFTKEFYPAKRCLYCGAKRLIIMDEWVDDVEAI
jgi:hypothetical protein